MTLEAGTKFGRDEIRSRIAEGGMRVVYLARDEKFIENVSWLIVRLEK